MEAIIVLSKTFKLNENITMNFVKFSDEEKVSVNLIEDGKVTGHLEKRLTPSIKKVLELKVGESISASNGEIICLESRSEILC